jgi:hypothetical protein
MALSKAEKQAVKSYRLWCVMQAEDQARADWELRMQDCLGLHNDHVRARVVGGYYTCRDAADRYAAELKLYPA